MIGYGATFVVATLSGGLQVHDISGFATTLTTSDVDTCVGVSHYRNGTAIVVWVVATKGTYYRYLYEDGAAGRTFGSIGIPTSALSLQVVADNYRGTAYAHITYMNSDDIFYVRIIKSTVEAPVTIYNTGFAAGKPQIDCNGDTVGITWQVDEGGNLHMLS